jgi:MoxR-like ATPase
MTRVPGVFVTLRRVSAAWPLIGRDEEIARAESRLARGTGTVIVGAAGVGKTALARQVGARVRVGRGPG